jgi:hypothetical protein
VRLTVLNATTRAVVAEGTLNETTYDYSYPSIAANARGDFVIGYSKSGFVGSGSGANRYAGAYATAGNLTGTTITFGTQIELRAGTNFYNLDFGSGRVRWGDYSATTVDPADPGSFWTNQEFVAASNVWSTVAAEILPTVPNEIRWSSVTSGGSGANAAGITGNFATAANWYNAAVPTSTSHTIFSRNGDGAAAYTVTLPAGTTTNDRASVRQGNVAWSIPGGATYNLANTGTGTSNADGSVNSPASLALSDYLGTSVLTVIGGGTLSTRTTTLASRLNSDNASASSSSVATLTISGTGTTWTNANNAYLGGNATRAGGTGTLNIIANATATVTGQVTLWNNTSAINVGATASPGTLTVGGLTNPSGTNPVVTVTAAGSRLRVLGAGSPDPFTGTVTVTGGTLDGTGTLAGTTRVGNNGILQGGTGTATTASNTLTPTNGLTFDGATTLRTVVGDTTAGNAAANPTNSLIQLNTSTLTRDLAGTASDLLTVVLVMDPALPLDYGPSYTITLIDYGTATNYGTIGGIPSNMSIGTPVGFNFAATPTLTLATSGLTLQFVAAPVPEPALMLLLGIPATVLLRRTKRGIV